MKILLVSISYLFFSFSSHAQDKLSIYAGIVGPLGVEVDGNLKYISAFGSIGTSFDQELMGTIGLKGNLGLIRKDGGFVSFHPGYMHSLSQFDAQSYLIGQLEFGVGKERDIRLRFGGGYGLKSTQYQKFYSLDLCIGYSF